MEGEEAEAEEGDHRLNSMLAQLESGKSVEDLALELLHSVRPFICIRLRCVCVCVCAPWLKLAHCPVDGAVMWVTVWKTKRVNRRSGVLSRQTIVTSVSLWEAGSSVRAALLSARCPPQTLELTRGGGGVCVCVQVQQEERPKVTDAMLGIANFGAKSSAAKEAPADTGEAKHEEEEEEEEEEKEELEAFEEETVETVDGETAEEAEEEEEEEAGDGEGEASSRDEEEEGGNEAPALQV